MKTVNSILGLSTLALLSCLFYGCVEEEKQEVSVKDLVGVWEDRSQNNTFIEEWSMHPDGGLTGTGFVLQARDTVFIEYLSIREFNGVLTYTAQVSDHNEGKAIPFSLKEKKERKMVFENPSHDFPQRIIYEVPNDSSMVVYIEGTENGSFRKRKLSFLKRSE